jgi:hypothetical protein
MPLYLGETEVLVNIQGTAYTVECQPAGQSDIEDSVLEDD